MNYIWRSFFQDFERDVFGEIISFKMQDLVHDLAQINFRRGVLH